MSGRSFKHAWNFLSDKTNSGKPGKKLTQLRRMDHCYPIGLNDVLRFTPVDVIRCNVIDPIESYT